MNIQKLEEALDFRDNYELKVKEAADFIETKLGDSKPTFGIVLGSGLGDIADSIEKANTIDYSEIPNFPSTTVPGHEGKMLIGELEGVPIIGLKGRTHYYEVADDFFNNGILKCVFPVHVLAELGVENYFVTNASGGLNQNYSVGDIMILKSHINLLPNPLLGRHHNFSKVDGSGRVWRFQPMNEAYDSKLTKILKDASLTHKDHFHEGVYVAVTGPSYETEGECIALRDGYGADSVGMSTTAEVIVARNRGMKAVGFSCITNAITAEGSNPTNHDEVKAILDSTKIRNRLSSTVRNFFNLYKQNETKI